MKKIKLISSVLAAAMLLSAFCGCGKAAGAASSAAPAPSSAAVASSSAAAAEPASSEPAAETESSYSYPKTDKENPIFISGELPKIEGPVLVTSAGQSADTNAMDSILKKAGIEHTTEITASAADIASAKTIFVAVGASMKGLGAAGISVEQELDRAKQALSGVAEDAVVICVHIGGEARRGDTSDPFIDLVMPMSDALIAVEGGNTDEKLTNMAKEADIPYGIGFAIQNCIQIAKDMA